MPKKKPKLTDEEKAVCNDIADRQKFRRAPKKMADVVSNLMARRGYAQAQTAGDLQAAWNQAAGESIAGHTRAGTVRRGVLQVFVRNSLVMQELTFQQKPILAKLKKLVPDQKIRSLRLQVGAID